MFTIVNLVFEILNYGVFTAVNRVFEIAVCLLLSIWCSRYPITTVSGVFGIAETFDAIFVGFELARGVQSTR